MKGITKLAAVGLAIVMLLVGIGIGYGVSFLAAAPGPAAQTITRTATVTTTVSGPAGATITETKTVTVGAPAGGLSGEVPIGALLPLSGPLAAFGENDKISIQTAVDEVNDFLAKSGANWRLRLYVEDTETKPEVALEKLMSLHAKGVKVVIGPMGSGEVLKIKEYADSNKILIISQSSTSPKLWIENDYVYRFVPNDLAQGPIGPKFGKNLGVTHIFLVYLANPWGDGLAEVAEKTAKELGITVAGKFRIAEAAPDYSAEVSSLVSEVNKLVGQGVAPEKIMVQLITYAEATTFMLSAREYDVLWRVKWFGSDGTAYEGTLIKEPKTAEFASSVRFVSPIFSPTKTPKYQELLQKISSQVGRPPEPYAYNTYDAVWVVALSLLSSQKYDSDAIISVMPRILEHYYGASGYIVLDSAGDRIAADYELTEILKKDGTYEWAATGVYYGTTGEIAWK
ncbi:MAG: ABC transporter substrate-binding protein [Nitrososphaerota archaeon]